MCCSLWGHKESDMTVIEQQQSSHRLDNLGFSCLASWMAPGPRCCAVEEGESGLTWNDVCISWCFWLQPSLSLKGLAAS